MIHETFKARNDIRQVSELCKLPCEKAEKANIKNNQNVPKFPQGKLNIFPRGLGN